MPELLYKQKEWLTVPDAAAHLSIAFGENVAEADVLRLGLDRHLTLSVDFVNGATGRLGKIVPRKQAPVRTLKSFGAPERKAVEMVGDVDFPEVGEALVFDHRDKTKLDSIFGIWDLPMRGAEELDVSYWYHELVGGPEVTLVNIAGTFVNRPDGAWCQLQEQVELRIKGPDGVERARVPGEKDLAGSTAVIRTARDGFRGHRRERSWIPAGALPDDVVLVVRTAALDDLKARVSQSSSTDSPPGTRTTRDATDGRPAEAVAAPGSTAAPFDMVDHNLDTSEGRRKAVDAFLQHCNSEQPHVLRRSHIWRAIGYTAPRSFQDWQAMSPKATRAFDENIRRILALSATDFLDLLSRQGLIKDE